MPTPLAEFVDSLDPTGADKSSIALIGILYGHPSDSIIIDEDLSDDDFLISIALHEITGWSKPILYDIAPGFMVQVSPNGKVYMITYPADPLVSSPSIFMITGSYVPA